MPTKEKKPESVKPPERSSTLDDLYRAVMDVRWANQRAARATRCKRCGIGDSYNMDAAVSRLLRVVLELPGEDIDLLLIPVDDD